MNPELPRRGVRVQPKPFGKENTCCRDNQVLWGHCEKHLTPRERVVWELVQAAKEAHSWMEEEGEYSGYWDSTERLRRAIAAVKEAT